MDFLRMGMEIEIVLMIFLYPRYCKVASSNTSHLEAHAGFLSLLMKENFDPYVLGPLDKKLIS